MKKKLGIVSTVVLTAILFMGVGAYAHATWSTFDADIAISENNTDEIMDILNQVYDDKLSAEQALAELEELNPAGLAKLNKELREENKELSDYIAHLENEVNRANDEVDSLKSKTDSAVEEARKFLD